MITAPCKDCADRHVGCHSSCEKYQAFHRENEARLEAQRMARVLDYDDAFIKRMQNFKYKRRRR